MSIQDDLHARPAQKTASSSANPTDWQLVATIVQFLRPYRWQIVIAAALLFATACLRLVPPLLLKAVIDRYLSSGSANGLGQLIAAYVFVLIGVTALEIWQALLANVTAQKVVSDLRRVVFERALARDVAFHDRAKIGDLVNTVTVDVNTLTDLLTSGVSNILTEALAVVTIAAALFFLDIQLAFAVLLVAPIVYLVIRWYRRYSSAAFRDLADASGALSAVLQEQIAGIETIQLHGAEHWAVANAERATRRLLAAKRRLAKGFLIFYPGVGVMVVLVMSVVLAVGGRRVLLGTMTLGSLVASLQYVQRFFGPFEGLAQRAGTFPSAMASARRVVSLMDTPPPVTDCRVSGDAHAGVAIRFEHVWFAYRPAEYVLKDVSFTVAARESVGIVGATGAGKSTILSLIMRFYDVERGRILVNGVDVRDYSLPDLRSLFAPVLQDAPLVPGTIESNIAVRPLRAGRIESFLADVGASDMLARLPMGAQHPVAEHERALAAGEKQIIALARAALADRACLLLDEATSRLDVTTHAAVARWLSTRRDDRTVLVVAHRLAMVEELSRILVFHHGQLVQDGSPAELRERDGIYRSLHELQRLAAPAISAHP